MTHDTGAALFVATLEELGVDTVFGIPGIHNLDAYDALLNSSIRHVTARNEAGAAFMADGYGRRSGRPGTVLVISGPGLTNTMTAVGEAYHDSVPLLLVSSDIPRRFKHNSVGYLHELPASTTMASSVTKYSLSVTAPGEIPDALRWLYRQATAGRPGPVHLEIPIDVFQEAETSVPADLITQLAGLVAHSDRIVVVAGGGAVRAAEPLTAFVEKANAIVVSTAAGKGAVSETHPRSLGGRLHLPAIRREIENADLVIGVGTQFSPTDLWVDGITPKGTVVQINRDASHMHANVAPDVEILADASTALNAVLDRMGAPGGETPARDVAALIEVSRNELGTVLGQSDQTLLRMRYVLEAIRKGLGSDGVLVADMTSIAYAALSEYITETPGGFLHPVGYGTLGYALPAAIGAMLAEPGRRIAALVGDGGFQFTPQELAVAIQERLPLPVIIWNDSGYGEIRREQESRHKGRRIAVDHEGPDFVKLAASYGITGVRLSDPEEVTGAIRQALKEQAPTIIEVPAT